MGSVSESFGLKYPEWQTPLRDALIELDRDKMKARVAFAESAILQRLELLPRDNNHHTERHALEDALSTLRALKRNGFGFLNRQGEEDQEAGE